MISTSALLDITACGPFPHFNLPLDVEIMEIQLLPPVVQVPRPDFQPLRQTPTAAVHFMEVKLDLVQVALRTSQMSLLANVRQKREVLSIKMQLPTEIALEVVIEEAIGFGSIAPPRLQLRTR